MHPINKHNFGVKGIAVTFYSNLTSTVVPGYVVKQTGTNSFRVSEVLPVVGTPAPKGKLVKLAPTAAIASALGTLANQGYCTIPVSTPAADGTGKVFTPTYEVDTVTMVTPGTAYTTSSVLTFGAGAATVNVTAVSSGAITTFTTPVTVRGNYTTLLTNPVTPTVTGGGSGATFKVTYRLKSIALSGTGVAYNVGDILMFGGTGTEKPTAHVSAVTTGNPTAVVIDNFGSGITVAGSLPVAGSADYACRIWDSKLRTVSGKTYPWAISSTSANIATIPTFS